MMNQNKLGRGGRGEGHQNECPVLACAQGVASARCWVSALPSFKVRLRGACDRGCLEWESRTAR